MAHEPFDKLAARYDAWFDSARGAALFRPEAECLESLMPRDRSGWVEVGVGSGRFAQALGVPAGLEPSPPLQEIARARGIWTAQGVAEALPYPDGRLDGVLLTVTLCFLDDPAQAMREFARVLRPGGRLLVGFVPADTPWGRDYARKSQEGHPFYAAARFYTVAQARELAEAAGLCFVRGASTLPDGPEAPLDDIPVRTGIHPGWGFVAMLFARPDVG